MPHDLKLLLPALYRDLEHLTFDPKISNIFYFTLILTFDLLTPESAEFISDPQCINVRPVHFKTSC